jgi:hypothetical protein
LIQDSIQVLILVTKVKYNTVEYTRYLFACQFLLLTLSQSKQLTTWLMKFTSLDEFFLFPNLSQQILTDPDPVEKKQLNNVSR